MTSSLGIGVFPFSHARPCNFCTEVDTQQPSPPPPPWGVSNTFPARVIFFFREGVVLSPFPDGSRLYPFPFADCKKDALPSPFLHAGSIQVEI